MPTTVRFDGFLYVEYYIGVPQPHSVEVPGRLRVREDKTFLRELRYNILRRDDLANVVPRRSL